VLAIAATLLLASCTEDPKPIEPKPSASAKPSATEPNFPARAREDTPSGAATFVGYWVSTFNYAARTGNAAPMREFAGKCKPCNRYARKFESLPRDKRPTGRAWTLKEVSVEPSRKPI
jgi:hypothetical protein